MNINNNNQDWDSDRGYSFVKFESRSGYNNWNVENYFPLDQFDLYDYEKDIFNVNIFGEQLYMVSYTIEGNTMPNVIKYKVLNKKGYKVTHRRDSNPYAWEIINPDGVKFYFNELNLSANTSKTQTDFGPLSVNTDYSRIWQISKIIDIYGEQIEFEYFKKNNIHSYSTQDGRKVGHFNASTQGTYFLGGLGWQYTQPCGTFTSKLNYMQEGDVSTKYSTEVISNAERSYVSKISYNNNKIKFNTISDRIDWVNTLKLSSIEIYNLQDKKIKTVEFEFENKQSCTNEVRSDKTLQELTNRLFLKSINNQNDKYEFTYNSTPLPSKDSYAVDFWGYYNGKINNSSKLPNILDFPDEDYNLDLESDITNNTAVLYSVEDYCKAGILEKIKYPTGGTTEFFYSLNQFDNNYVPINPIYPNTGTYYGNGLKIDLIVNNDEFNNPVKKKYYQYENGKLLMPIKHFITEYEQCVWLGSGESTTPTSGDLWYPVNKLSGEILNIFSGSQYSSGLTGESNGVAYGKVITWERNSSTNANDNGKTIHFYVNNPDVLCPVQMGELIPIVPTYHKGLKNGTLTREEIYDNTNAIKSSSQYSYNITYNNDTIEYNSKLTYKGYDIVGAYGGPKKTILVSYYPIYKPETLLNKKVSSLHFGSDSLSTTENYIYDSYNNIKSTSKQNSKNIQEELNIFYYPYDIKDNTNYTQVERNIMTSLFSNNRFTEKIKSENANYTLGNNSVKTQYSEYAIVR